MMAGMDENPYKSPESRNKSNCGFRPWEPTGRWIFVGSVVTFFVGWAILMFYADRAPPGMRGEVIAALATLPVPTAVVVWAICAARDRIKRK